MAKRKYNDDNKLQPEQLDPKAIWFNANLFLKAAERCGSESDGHNWLVVPEIVNSTFACELFMKCIILIHGTEQLAHTHSLKKLFNLLPSNIQSEIQTDLSSLCEDFDRRLAEISDLFEECRYAFEYERLCLNLPYLRKLTRLLWTISVKLVSELT
jgi:HEPN domain-containing protein